MFKAILFDLDNTLFDRNATAANYYGLLYDLYGKNAPVTRDEAVRLTMIADADGYGDRPFLYSRMQHDWGYGVSREEMERHWKDDMHRNLVRFDGVREGLLALREKGYKIGLITNGLPTVQGEKLRIIGIEDLFDSILISKEIGIAKPDPRVYRLALDRLGVTADEAVYVGDYYLNDVAGAVNAGISAIWYGGHEGHFVPYVNSMAELVELL